MNDVYRRRPVERKVIKLNCKLQAIADDDKVLSEFTNVLGTLARQSVPLDCLSWHKFPEQQKEELWSFVKVNRKHKHDNLLLYFVLSLGLDRVALILTNFASQNMIFLRKEGRTHCEQFVLCGGCTKADLRRTIILSMIMTRTDSKIGQMLFQSKNLRFYLNTGGIKT